MNSFLDFKYNWNNKLDCPYFTTLRLSDRFNMFEIIDVTHKGEALCKVRVIAKRSVMLHQINDFIAYIDTGYGVQECKDMIRMMYKYKNIDWTVKPLWFYLLEKQAEPDPQPGSFCSTACRSNPAPGRRGRHC